MKRTFSLDEATAAEIGRLSDVERRHLLRMFDDFVPQIPFRDVAEVEAELADIRRSRRAPPIPGTSRA
jgi:hypothetical protein